MPPIAMNTAKQSCLSLDNLFHEEEYSSEMEIRNPEVTSFKPVLIAPSHSLSLASQNETKDLLPKFLQTMREMDWDKIERLLDIDPSLSRRQVTLISEGMKSNCLPLHLCCTRRAVPFHIIDLLVTLYPSALLEPEERGSRFPLHIATSRGMSQEIVNYLCNTRPQALQYADQDGNFPLHYAAMYSSSNTLQLFAHKFPQASRSMNERNRLPLHLLCARFFQEEEFQISSNDLKVIIEAYPDALQISDRCGRLPLHLAADDPNAQWDILETLIQGCPAALLHKEISKQTPLLLAKKRLKDKENPDHKRIISSLTKLTVQERRKEFPYLPAFMVNTTFPLSPSNKGKEKTLIL
jgi:hypothetical protein